MLTLAEKMKREDPDHKIAAIIELLSETNEILMDAVFMEGNLPTGHKTTVRTGLPSVTWRRLNYGVQPSKSQTAQVTDTCGMLEAYAEVDKDLADLNGNTASFRLSEDSAFLEAMNQEMADTLFYGDTGTDPEKFLGLTPRFDAGQTTPNTRTVSTYQVVDGGGTGSDNTSMWIIGWGDNAVFMTYPKGSQAGLQHKDLGEVTLEDADGGKFQGYRSHYQWKAGLVVKDWRQVARVANIDVSAMRAGSVNVDDKLIDAYYRIKNRKAGNMAIYCNQDVAKALHKRSLDKTNVNLTSENFDGKPVTRFLGIPIRTCEAILNTESLATFA
jgi:hypothetical protein